MAAAAEGIHVASAVCFVLLLFVNFVKHYGQDAKALKLPSKAPLRVVAVALATSSYVAEVALVIQTRTTSGPHILSATYCAAAWASTVVRKSLLPFEVCVYAILSLAFGIPLLALKAATLTFTLEHPLFGIQAARLVIIFLLLLDSLLHVAPKFRRKQIESADAGEAQPFLDSPEPSNEHGSYGTDGGSVKNLGDDSDEDDDEDNGDTSRTTQLRKSGDWATYLRGFKIFIPFLIPRKDLKVQLCLIVCIFCLIGGRLLNVFIPQQLGIIVDTLTAGASPWRNLGIHFVLSVLNSHAGVSGIESLAKVPIEIFSYRQLTNAAFGHVMSLGIDFHSENDSGEVMRGINQGEALTRILDMAVLEIAPTVLDVVVAFVLLYTKFNSTVALCMLTASVAFLASEIVTSSWNIQNRRRMTEAERQESRVMHQAVQGWRTVAAFNRFIFEKQRFASAVTEHMNTQWDWSKREAIVDGILDILPPATFFALASLVIHEVHAGRATAGDLVFLISYWDFLMFPLKYLASEYRWLMRDLIRAERLLDLLTTEPTVKDRNGAFTLRTSEGAVSFENVCFSYDERRTALHNIDIHATPGETIALVGATGAGKSTVTKLLLRYYDVTSGSIQVDGHDIRDVTQSSLRDAIGLVPQDPLLFNATVMENIRYAKLSATDAEVFEACRAAAIHDKITSFPDGYKSKVGEQGMKLSGGEIQRLAIARVFLKNPSILILDEATSSVDTETEAAIQASLRRLAHKRTAFVIAHRLSTVVSADKILVIDDGRIIEQGKHHELIQRGGKYATLWQKQLGETSDEPLADI